MEKRRGPRTEPWDTPLLEGGADRGVGGKPGEGGVLKAK